MNPLTIAEQRGVIELVTAWSTNTELSAARQMYAIAKLLGVEPPEPVAGKRRVHGPKPERAPMCEENDDVA